MAERERTCSRARIGRTLATLFGRGCSSAAQASGKPVFVDFTAAWCVTCQVNKRLVLESEPIRRGFERKQVTLLRADWTNRDAGIAAALARLGRSGVPVYALYAPPAGASPRLLPEILTRDLVHDALDALPFPSD